MGGNIYSRQNDKIAIRYRKACKLVYGRERFFKGVIIAMSVILCVLSIVNKYLFRIFPGVEFFSANQEMISRLLVLLSGILMIIQIAIGRYHNRMHIEGVGFEERYDNYVFGMRPNKLIMRPISETNIETYAAAVRKPDEFFCNYYFDTAGETFERNAQFKHYKRIFENEYKLLLNVKGFFQTIWIGFMVAIMAVAISFDVSFVETLVNILIPSLSILSLIFNAWYTFGKQMNYLQNALNNLDELAGKQDLGGESPESPSNALVLRSIQDSLYYMRMNDFDVPAFLRRYYKRRDERLLLLSGKNGKGDKVMLETRSLIPVTRNPLIDKIKRADVAVKQKLALNLDEVESVDLEASPRKRKKSKSKPVVATVNLPEISPQKKQTANAASNRSKGASDSKKQKPSNPKN